jgi:hypothetical protein
MSAKVKIKTIALPVEHGGWGFLFEPILLALPVAFSQAGVCLAVAVVSTFLLRHPLKIFLRGREPLAKSPRRRAALIVSLIYTGVSLTALAGTVALDGLEPLVPLVILSPWAALYYFYDAKKQSRLLIAELAGPFALAGVAVGVAVAGGWERWAAWALWVIVLCRTIPSIFYVRARLRVERDRPVSRVFVFVIHLLFGIALGILVWKGLSPRLALAAFAILWFRALKGLSGFRRPSKAIRIGFLEIGYGLLYIAVIVVGFLTGI